MGRGGYFQNRRNWSPFTPVLTVLSTDDEEIASAGCQMGLEVPFMRPPALARDDTPTIPVLQDVVRRLAKEGAEYDAIFTLQPTNPLRTVEDIDGATALMEKTGADSVVGYSDVGEKHPARMIFIDDDGRALNPPFAEQFDGQPRQELPNKSCLRCTCGMALST